jgi:hypothetical protein
MLSLVGMPGLGGLILTGYLGGFSVPALTAVGWLLMGNRTVLLLGFHLLGEYVGRIHVESRKRPLYLIERTLNLEPAEEHDPPGPPRLALLDPDANTNGTEGPRP